MSIFTSISNAEHTFVAWWEKELAKVEKSAPTIEAGIESGVNYSVGVLRIVASQVEAGSPTAKLLSKAVSDLLTVSAVSQDAGAHPTLAGMFQDVVGNLSGLEALGGIKSAATLATVSKVVSTLETIASAVLNIAPAALAAV